LSVADIFSFVTTRFILKTNNEGTSSHNTEKERGEF
jgi:hypothetical protein